MNTTELDEIKTLKELIAGIYNRENNLSEDSIRDLVSVSLIADSINFLFRLNKAYYDRLIKG